MIIGLSIFFPITFFTTLCHLYGKGYVIDRKWWDDDYKRLGKTNFKSRIKGIFLSLLINIIFYSLIYYSASTEAYAALIVLVPVFIFLNYLTFDNNPDY